MAERITLWSRRFMRPRVTFIRPARPHPIFCWNRYGDIPGTPYRGVTIGLAVMFAGRGMGVRWARPVARTEVHP